jgi:hypothetical protein
MRAFIIRRFFKMPKKLFFTKSEENPTAVYRAVYSCGVLYRALIYPLMKSLCRLITALASFMVPSVR